MGNFPFFDLTRQYQGIKNEVQPVIQAIFERQSFVMGEEVTKLESELSQYMGVKHAITCSSGTDALVLSLKALGIGEGDEVITPAFSFFASTSSVLLAGARPVFADIEPRTFNIDIKNLETALTRKTKAIMPVHLFGQCADMEMVLSFANKHGLVVIEDAAQAIGATFNGKGAGTMGTLGATSFYPTKNLGGAGEGGLVATNNDELAEKIRLLRVHGMKVRYTHEMLGWNSRMDAIQAAVLRIKLRKLDSWVERRGQLASQYHEKLAPLESKNLIRLPENVSGRNHVWNQYVVLVENRDQVRSHLDAKGIPTDIYYPKTIPAQPVLSELGYGEEKYKVSIDCAKKALALPIFPELTDDEQRQVVGGLEVTLSQKL